MSDRSVNSDPVDHRKVEALALHGDGMVRQAFLYGVSDGLLAVEAGDPKNPARTIYSSKERNQAYDFGFTVGVAAAREQNREG